MFLLILFPLVFLAVALIIISQEENSSPGKILAADMSLVEFDQYFAGY